MSSFKKKLITRKISSLNFVLQLLLCFSIHVHSQVSKELKTNFGTGKLSLSHFAFTENKGQVTGNDNSPLPEVKFTFQQNNLSIFLLQNGLAYQFTNRHYPETDLQQYSENGKVNSGNLELLAKQIRTETYRMDMILQGADIHAQITTEGRSTDYENYYNHNALDVHHYQKIIYHNIYPGIDWVIYVDGKELKYDFVLKPGANPSLIKIQFKNQEDLKLNKDGSLTLKNRLGTISEKTPVSFQNEKQIKTNFVLKNNMLSFSLSNYDLQKSLTIDPLIVWGTYYGKSGDDLGQSCVSDASGNVYLSGYTGSSANMTSGGYQITFGGVYDAFLVKFDNTGARLWATYYGGAGIETGNACTTDLSGNVYLTGMSAGGVTMTPGSHQSSFGGSYDAFLAKFDPSGNLIWSTYYGDTGNDVGSSCVSDVSGNIYMVGSTTSGANIASGGYQNSSNGANDLFLVKFSSIGVRQWATYYGGSGDDRATKCILDNASNIYFTGTTTSTSNIATGGHQTTYGGGLYDACLVKFSTAGIFQWATYYGGTDAEAGNSCASDNSGNVYLVGSTSSTNNISSGGFQNTLGGSNDAFLVKFNGNGIRQWSSYFGGSTDDYGATCATDQTDNIYVMGSTGSTSGISYGGFQNTYGGNFNDGYVVKFKSNGNRLFASYYGGLGQDVIAACFIDAQRNIYIAGNTMSTNNISTSGVYQNSWSGGSNDAFVSKFCTEPDQPLAISGNSVFCTGGNQTYSVTNDPYATGYNWTLPANWGGGSPSYSITTLPGTSGGLSVTATNACGTSSAQVLNITVNGLPTITVNNGSICTGQSFSLNPAGASSYTITGGSAIVSPLSNASYSVTGTTTAGCLSTVPVVAHVTVYAVPIISVNNGVICNGQSFTIIPSGASTYTFSGGSAIVSPNANTSYSISGTSTAGCVSTLSAISVIAVNPLPAITLNSGYVCYGNSFTLAASGANSYTFSSGTNIVNPLVNTSYSVTGTSLAGCVSTIATVATVSVYPFPVISVNSGAICSGQSFNILPNGASTYTYSGGLSSVSPTVNTSYSIIGTSSMGCISQTPAISNVVVNALPTLTVSSSSSLVCAGESLTLSANGASLYTWNSSLVGNTLVVNPTVNSNYTITGTDGNGCSSTVLFTQNVDACTALTQNLKSETGILIYPNPNAGILFIEINSQAPNYSFKLINALGQCVLSSGIGENVTIDISGFASGVYFAAIFNGKDQVRYQKIIKE